MHEWRERSEVCCRCGERYLPSEGCECEHLSDEEIQEASDCREARAEQEWEDRHAIA